MRFYCTHCWAEMAESATCCPCCGDDIAARQARADFVEKLIAALHHPEPTTPIRAAWILGQRRECRALGALIQLARHSQDPFIAAAAIEAIGQIDGESTRETLHWAATHGSIPVRRAAEQTLRKLEKQRHESLTPTPQRRLQN